MCRILSRLSNNALARMLVLCAIGAAIFGAVAGYVINEKILVPALFGALCGTVSGGIGAGLHRIFGLICIKGWYRRILTIVVFVLLGPLLVGFVTAFAARHPAGTAAVAAMAGLFAVGPMLAAVCFGIIGARYARSVAE